MGSETDRTTPGGPPDQRDGLSWDCGPANSRFVRLLAYPAIGLSGGLVVGFLVLFGPPFLLQFAGESSLWLLAVAVVGIFVLAPRLWAVIRTRRVRRERSRLVSEWYDVTRSMSSVVAVLLIGGVLVGAGLVFDWSHETYLAVGFAAILVGQALALLAGFLGSIGAIDAENLTLSYAGRDDVDLRRLRDVKRLSFGRYTVLWLLVSHSVEGERDGEGITGKSSREEKPSRTGGPGQDLYAMPTDLVERAWPVFERGMAAGRAETGTGAEGSNVLRRVNLAVSLVFVAGGVAMFAFLAWLGTPAWQLLQWLWILSGVVVIFVRILARTY
jgi:hypothetical protein